MTSRLHVTPEVSVPDTELSWRFSRSSGPGGQGVDTTDSRVELLFDVVGSPALAALDPVRRERMLERLAPRLVNGVLTVVASEHRSQIRNRDAARARLAAVLREALAPGPAPRRPTRPTRGSQRRRMEDKARRGQLKRQRRRPDD